MKWVKGTGIALAAFIIIVVATPDDPIVEIRTIW